MIPDNLPAWLRPAHPITKKDTKALAPKARSWTALDKVIHELTELQLLKIVAMELASGAPRPLIISRCLSRFRTTRTRRENAELFAVTPANVKDYFKITTRV